MPELIQVSIVIAAASHNPSILHPAFLKAEGIVPSDWEPTEPSVSTPVVATVQYGKITITADQSKVQFIDSAPPHDLSSGVLPGFAQAYAAALPKVRYTGVGINPWAFIGRAEPKDYLLRQFLRDDWRQANPVDDVDLRFVLRALNDSRLQLSFSTGGRLQPSGSGQIGVIAKSNYHFDVSSLDSLQDRLEAFVPVCEDFVGRVERFLK